MAKMRLDHALVERGLVPTRAKAKGIIMAGEVKVNGQMVDKAGTMVKDGDEIQLAEVLPYVGRGGLKLAGALDQFPISIPGAVCADVGACTGGFTDVLLQRGAARVFAIDVGYGQLDWKLRQDDRVEVMERTNARYVEALAEAVEFVCIDVSFISLKLILPAVRRWLTLNASVIALIKPQFEAGKGQVGKGGIIRDPLLRKSVVQDVLQWCVDQHWSIQGLLESSIKGSDGNVEYLVWLKPDLPQTRPMSEWLADVMPVVEPESPPADS